MDYSVYYHRDFDGVASAALVLRWLGGRGTSHAFGLTPVDYGLHWMDLKLPSPSIVVDFLYHPDAIHYWDHHRSPFLSAAWQKHYDDRRARQEPGVYWDPNYPSCAALLLDDLPELQRDPHARELAGWATIIDSAAYDSPASLFSSTEPAMNLNLALTEGDDDFFNSLVRGLAEGWLESVSNRPETRAAINSARHHQRTELMIFRERVQVRENLVVIADLSDTELRASRYAPYYVDREALYSVVLHRTAKHIKILCMRNPWIEFESYDIGQLCQQFGGGGHKRVGAALFGLENLVQARIAFSHISDTLTKDARTKAPLVNAAI